MQRLQTALIDATTAKLELVDVLRNLGEQFNSLQEHANNQCDVLVSGGEEAQFLVLPRKREGELRSLLERIEAQRNLDEFL